MIVITLYLSLVTICLYSFCVISFENFSIKYFTILVSFHTFYDLTVMHNLREGYHSQVVLEYMSVIYLQIVVVREGVKTP